MKQIWRIIRFTRELWPLYIAVGVFAIMVAATAQVQPLLIRAAIDEITKAVQGDDVRVLFVAMLAILVFTSDVFDTLFSNIGGYIGDVLSARLKKLMSQRYYKHLLTLPQGYFDNELSGKILNRLNRGLDQIANYMRALSNNFLQFLFSSTLSLIIIYIFSWQVGLMLTLLYPVFIYLTAKTSGKWQKYQHEINHQQDVATGRFAEVINQIKVVKSFRQSVSELTIFKDRFSNVIALTRPQSKYWHQRDVYRRLALNVIFLGVYSYIFVAAATGQYSVGTMVLLIMYASNIRMPLFSISFIVDQTQRAIANTKDYFEVMDVTPDIVDAPNAKALKLKTGSIEFKDVKFGYSKENPIFTGLNFSLEPGSKNALVGESGEGKTTISNLLLRLYSIDDGHINIDGQDIAEVTQSSLRQNIGVVFQEAALFSGTIRENIAYGKPEATKKEIESAAMSANADSFITKFDHGYDTEIGERGLKLSGGQKQRIAIARALLKNAPILILDEATSSLDTKSEKLVQDALEELMKNRTTLIIAHRLSTIQSVDQVITIRSGQVDEVGSPKELARSNGIYAELLQLQQLDTEASQKRFKKFGIEN
ncbi:MAG: ABC transporter ATP-binding protein/permease [bacterium]|nr:ABC transporter ATP-binding protein/permease [bacterium]MDN5835033.1 ABC transporter ATP-binding protein/permease [bacterium]